MSILQIGRLEKQCTRSVWPTEPGDFTPWLAQPEILSFLAATLGLGDLTKVQTEVAVGSFRADIRCTDAMDNVVLIENQFGATDHQHLGQTLTYLSAATPAASSGSLNVSRKSIAQSSNG